MLLLLLITLNSNYPIHAEPQETSSASGITLDFDRVDIRTFIAAISKFTGYNFAVAPEIHGEITVYCPTQLDVQGAYAVFLSVLDLHGLNAVQSGDIIKIMPAAQARKEGIPVIVGQVIPDNLPPDSLMTLIMPLKNLKGKTSRETVLDLLSKSASVEYQEERNMIVITDKVLSLKRMIALLNTMDQPGIPRLIKSIPLKNASSTQIITNMQSFLADFTNGMNSEEKPSLLDDPRTNSIVLYATERDMPVLTHLIEQFDASRPENMVNTVVITLEHIDADKLAEVLSSQIKASGEKSAPSLNLRVSIIADKTSNSLIISGTPEDIQTLKPIITSLDVARSQVLVEAVILEITMKRLRELGIEWQSLDQPGTDSTTGFGGTRFPSGGEESPLQRMSQNPFDSPSGMSFGILKGSLTIGGVEYFNIGALLHTLQDDSQVNILSTPRIMTVNNEEAEIVVGEERPYLKSSQTTDSDQLLRTYEYKDIGITLRITPHISLGNSVRLNLFQEIKNFVKESDIGAVTTTKRHAKTTVVVGDGETVVIGGLIHDDSTGATLKVPCLGSLPLLGWFFKSIRGERNKTNLIIFITPHILKSEEEIRAISKELIEETEKSKTNTQTHEQQLREEVSNILDESGVKP